MYFLLCKGRSNDDVGIARGTGFQALRPGAGFKTGDFVKNIWGAAVERLIHIPKHRPRLSPRSAAVFAAAVAAAASEQISERPTSLE